MTALPLIARLAEAHAAGRLDQALTVADRLLSGDHEPVRTPREAEMRAAAWMRSMGYADAIETPVGPDGGVDVRATGAAAQVKHHIAKVCRADVQRIYGVARSESRRPLFFALESDQGHYSKHAIEWASSHGVTLFAYRRDGSLRPVTADARSLMARRALVAVRSRRQST